MLGSFCLAYARTQVTELALNPELNRQLEAKKRHGHHNRNYMARNKGKTRVQSRAVRRERQEEETMAGDVPYVIAEGTIKQYGHVESKFMKDAAIKGAPPSKSRTVEVRGNAWVPNARGSVRREPFSKPRPAKRVEVEIGGGPAAQPWNVSQAEKTRLDKLRSKTYRERVKRAEEEDALVDHDQEFMRTEAYSKKTASKGRVLAMPKYLVDRKKELAAASADERQASLDIDPDPPEGYRWLAEQQRKAGLRKWTVRKRELQAELDGYSRIRDTEMPGLWKKTKQAELKMTRASDKLRLYGVGRSRAAVLTDQRLLNDPGCPLKVEESFVVGGTAAKGSIQRTRVYVVTDTAKIKVEVNLDTCTIKQLKEKVEEKAGAPPRWQKLVYRGKTLSDAKLLTHYGIVKDAAIRLEMRALADPLPPQHMRTQPPSIVKPPWALE